MVLGLWVNQFGLILSLLTWMKNFVTLSIYYLTALVFNMNVNTLMDQQIKGEKQDKKLGPKTSASPDDTLPAIELSALSDEDEPY